MTPELLRERGMVSRGKQRVKVLARGEIDKALTVRVHKFSGKAAEKITAAGGSAEAIADGGNGVTAVMRIMALSRLMPPSPDRNLVQSCTCNGVKRHG